MARKESRGNVMETAGKKRQSVQLKEDKQVEMESQVVRQ